MKKKKLALEKAKQAEIDELRGQVRSKDQQLEKSRSWVSELEKAHADSFKAASRLKAEVKYIEEK